MRGTTVLGDGPLTPSAVELLDGQGATVAIAAADTDAQDAGTGEPATADVTARRLTPQVVLAPFDPAVGAALAAVGTDPALPTYLDPALAVPLNHDSTAARRQDAVGHAVAAPWPPAPNHAPRSCYRR
jgi:hypothetical protein